MGRLLRGLARLLGTAIGAFAGVVAVQLMRLRRMDFLPSHPGFYINHVVTAANGARRGDRLRLVVLGDSTTAGVGVERAEDALPHLIAQRIADAESRPVHVVSYGWAGARAADVARIQLPRALEPLRETETEPFLPGADVVAVVIGANDATHNTLPWRFRADIRATLAGIRSAAPNARVVLAGIPAFRGALRGIEPLIFLADQYSRFLRPISRIEAERAGVAHADLAGEVPSRLRGRHDSLSSDRFHPSVVGYRVWADVIVEALDPGHGRHPADAVVDPAGA
ncbi:MAG TPA: GDSL-type esterase/lipase family protein [Candidatus Binatia bacterium]|nr:GDSL-type esterase/lipase family protein [Candidatus Binatia bacterium]